MTQTTLSAAVRELVAALNGRDADTAKAWCTRDAWDGGPLPLEPLCRDEHLLLQVAPVLLETDQRAAARLVGFREDKSRDSLWFLFEQFDDGWKCVGGSRTRLDAEGFLTGRRGAQDKPSAPAQPTQAAPKPEVPGPSDMALLRAVERLVAALETADADAGRALSEEGHWDFEGDSPARLFRHVAKSPSDVGIAAWRVRGDRAAVRLVLSASRGSDDLWVVWRLRRGLGWKMVAAPHEWEPAGLFVTRTLDEVPRWSALVPDADATRWAQAVIAASAAGEPAPAGVSDEAFAALAQAPEGPGQELRVGEAVSLPALGRAMVRVDVVDPTDDFAVDQRWALLERGAADAPWRFRKLMGMGALVSLLDGVEVTWEEQPAEEAPASAEGDEMARKAVLAAVHEVLKANNIDPEALGVDQMSREQLEKLLPQVIGRAFGALFATAFKGIVENIEDHPAAPEGTIDLAAEREKRSGDESSELERDLARTVRGAIADVVRPKVTPDGSVKVDVDFLQQTGPQLLGSLFGAVAKAVVPANVKVDLPPAEGDPEGKPVKMEIPLGEILGQLFGAAASAARPRPAEASNEPDEPDEPAAEPPEPPDEP